MHPSFLCKIMANTFHYVIFNMFLHSVANNDLGNQCTFINKDQKKDEKSMFVYTFSQCQSNLFHILCM